MWGKELETLVTAALEYADALSGACASACLITQACEQNLKTAALHYHRSANAQDHINHYVVLSYKNELERDRDFIDIVEARMEDDDVRVVPVSTKVTLLGAANL